jgi:hypothetical protein
VAAVLAVHALLLMDTPFGRSERERPAPNAALPVTLRMIVVEAPRPTVPPSGLRAEPPRAAPAANAATAAPKARRADRPVEAIALVESAHAATVEPSHAALVADRPAIAGVTPAPAEGAEPPV